MLCLKELEGGEMINPTRNGTAGACGFWPFVSMFISGSSFRLDSCLDLDAYKKLSSCSSKKADLDLYLRLRVRSADIRSNRGWVAKSCIETETSSFNSCALSLEILNQVRRYSKFFPKREKKLRISIIDSNLWSPVWNPVKVLRQSSMWADMMGNWKKKKETKAKQKKKRKTK